MESTCCTSAEQNRFSRSLFLGDPRIFAPPALAALRFSYLFAPMFARVCPLLAPCRPSRQLVALFTQYSCKSCGGGGGGVPGTVCTV